MAQVSFTPATDVAFGIVFALFVLALLVLAFVTVRWGIRRDRPGRQAWRQSRLDPASERNGTSPFESGDQGAQGPGKEP